MAGRNSKDEPSTAPEPERWYNLTLGSSFSDHHQSPKFCTLRYEFKPASIDKKQPGSLHRNKDNRVSVEFQNNQHGKPKVMFEGISEDYKDNDAVLFFDGETFRLERLHRAVKRLRHVRLPGESVATTATAAVTSNASMLESGSPTLGKGTKFQSLSKDILHQNPVEMETFDINRSESLGGGKISVNDADPSSSHPNISTASSDPRNYEIEEQIDILNNSDDDDDGYKATEKGGAAEREFTTGIDINVPHQADVDDDEMADVDVSGDEAESGPNAAEALRAQVNAEGRGIHSSSSTSSSSSSSGSGSGSSDSESGSSSSDSESGDGDGDGDSINSI